VRQRAVFWVCCVTVFAGLLGLTHSPPLQVIALTAIVAGLICLAVEVY